MTAMAVQISAMRSTWPVLTDFVLVISEALNDPRSSTALGATWLRQPGLEYHGCGPVRPETEPKPMARFAHAVRLS